LGSEEGVIEDGLNGEPASFFLGKKRVGEKSWLLLLPGEKRFLKTFLAGKRRSLLEGVAPAQAGISAVIPIGGDPLATRLDR
jgi:hypothetical protein